MTQDEKALLYDDYVREGDRINRKISAIKSNINRTPQQETELADLNKKLSILEGKVAQLYTM